MSEERGGSVSLVRPPIPEVVEVKLDEIAGFVEEGDEPGDQHSTLREGEMRKGLPGSRLKQMSRYGSRTKTQVAEIFEMWQLFDKDCPNPVVVIFMR